jgi:hypothetical protein
MRRNPQKISRRHGCVLMRALSTDHSSLYRRKREGILTFRVPFVVLEHFGGWLLPNCRRNALSSSSRVHSMIITPKSSNSCNTQSNAHIICLYTTKDAGETTWLATSIVVFAIELACASDSFSGAVVVGTIGAGTVLSCTLGQPKSQVDLPLRPSARNISLCAPMKIPSSFAPSWT